MADEPTDFETFFRATEPRLWRTCSAVPGRRRSEYCARVRVGELGPGRSDGVPRRVSVPGRALEISASKAGRRSCTPAERGARCRTRALLGVATASASTARSRVARRGARVDADRSRRSPEPFIVLGSHAPHTRARTPTPTPGGRHRCLIFQNNSATGRSHSPTPLHLQTSNGSHRR